MHGYKAHAALCYHIRRYRTVDAAGQQCHAHAVAADGHTARTGGGRSVDIGRQIAYLNVHGQLRLVDVHGAARVGLRQLAADELSKLYARHGEALIAALALDLEASRAEHIVPEVAHGKLRYLPRLLFAAGGAVYRCDAEHLRHSLEGRVHIARIVNGLNIGRRLHQVGPEISDALEAALYIAHELLFKGAAVEALEHDLAELEKDNIVYHVFSPEKLIVQYKGRL